MRILFLCNPWAITREPARLVGVHPELREGPHQWIRAVGGPAVAPTDIAYDMRRDGLRDIARRCPGGNPDAMIVWAPGYQALPAGIEDAPFPVVACYSDWPLLMPGQAGMLHAYDYIFTCRGGVRTHQSLGYENVEYWPMYGHDPLLSRVMPEVEKVWDIGMVGNLSPVVQRERAPWLARVARLADRYRVRIAGGLFNEEYTRMMNATKITFNRAFRIDLNGHFSGAMNMRCYEAAACGSLLFCEEENEEVRDFFEDRVHCVLYNERNLEELLDHYLTHDEERERITAAAAERVAEFSFPRNLRRLADRLGELDVAALMRSRIARSLPVPDLRKRHARQVAGTMTLGALDAALGFLRQTLESEPTDADAHNDLAVITAMAVGEATDSALARELTTRALRHVQRAMELCPASAFYSMNLAHMYADTGWNEAALEQVQRALVLLDSTREEPSDPLCLPFPYTWDEFRVQYSVLFTATSSMPECFHALRRCLLLYRGGTLLGKLAEQQGLPDMAVMGYRIAAAARPDLGMGRIGLARSLAGRVPPGERAAADIQEALAHLAAGLQSDPFATEAWRLYGELQLGIGGTDAAETFLAERLTTLEALVPPKERLAISAALPELERTRLDLLELLQRARCGAPRAERPVAVAAR